MNSYKDLALYDIASAKANYAYALWNKVGRECQQACEKYLKHFLQERHLLGKDLERTHNLKKLFMAVPEYDAGLYKDLSVVGDYYYEVNYPGDNFIQLDQNMADEAMAVTRELFAYLDAMG